MFLAAPHIGPKGCLWVHLFNYCVTVLFQALCQALGTKSLPLWNRNSRERRQIINIPTNKLMMSHQEVIRSMSKITAGKGQRINLWTILERVVREALLEEVTFKQGPERSERTSHLKIREKTFQAEEQPENQWGWGVVGEEEGGRIRLERQAGARVQWGLVATVASSGFSLSKVGSSDTR